MLTEEQKKAKAEYKKNKKIKKWHRRARCRFLKNLLIWFVGFISSLAIVGGGAYIAIGVIPLNNFVGNDETYVSNKVASETVLSLFQNLNGYKVSDFPVLDDALLSLTAGLGVDGLVSIDTEKISSLSIGSITSGEGIDALLSAVNVEATFKDVVDMTGFSLGNLTNLDVFTKYEIVTEKPSSEEYGSPDFNHNKYYYEKEPGVYAPAFVNNDYAPGVDSNTDLYYPPLNEVGILDLFDIFDSALNRIKVSELINTFMSGEDESSDTSVASLLTNIFGDTTVGNIGEFDYTTIALNNLLPAEENPALYDILKDISKESDATLITIAHLTGIDESTINSIRLCSIIKTEDENGNPTNQDLWEIIEGLTGETAENITIGVLTDIDPQEVAISAFLGSYEENKAIYDLLKAITGEEDINNIYVKDLSIDLDTVDVSALLGEESENPDVYKLLRNLTGKKEGEPITVADIKKLDQNNIALESVLPRKENGEDVNKEIWDILDAVVKPKDSSVGITIGDLGSGFNLDNLPLSKVIEEGSLWDILSQAVTATDVSVGITVGDLKKGFVINNVTLESVLPKQDNTAIWDILETVVTYDKQVGITIGNLSSFNLDNLPLSKVIDEDTTLWNILKEATFDPENPTKVITVGVLKTGFSIDNVKLETVLPNNSTNSAIWNILSEAVTASGTDGEIRIKDLGFGFNMENVSLSTVYPDDGSTLWTILKEATFDPENPTKVITIYDLKNNFKVDNIHLSSVIKETHGNQVLEALLLEEDATLGNIATKLNELKLKEMYNINCFTKNVSEATAGSPKYSLSKLEDETGNHDHYTLNENGEYYIKKDAGVWLLLLYKADEKDTNGDALTYTCKCLTLGSLTNTIASAADCFMNATIKMLVDSGILVESVPDQYLSIYAFSVKNVFDTAAFGLSQ